MARGVENNAAAETDRERGMKEKGRLPGLYTRVGIKKMGEVGRRGRATGKDLLLILSTTHSQKNMVTYRGFLSA